MLWKKGKSRSLCKKIPIFFEKRDFFHIAGQVVENVKQSSENSHISTRVLKQFHLDDYEINSDPQDFNDNRVLIENREGKNRLVIEGLLAGRATVRHIFTKIEPLKIQSNGEILAVLDRKKGLLLADWFFIRLYLGQAPIPLFWIPLMDWQKKVEALSLSEQKSLEVEFISDRGSTKMPGVFPESISSIPKTFQNKYMFKAGDLMISYQSEKDGNKHLLQFITQAELYAYMALQWRMVHLISTMLAPQYMSQADMESYSKDISTFINKNKENADVNPSMLDLIQSKFLLRNPFTKLSLILLSKDHFFSTRLPQLETLANNSNSFTLEEWKQTFENTVSSQDKPLPEKGKEAVLQTNLSEKRGTGPVSRGAKVRAWVKDHKVKSGFLGVAGLVAFYPHMVTWTLDHLHAYVNLASSYVSGGDVSVTRLSSIFHGGFIPYEFSVLPQYMTMTFAIFLTLVASSWLFYKGADLLYQKLPEKSSSDRVLRFKGHIKDFLKKWENNDALGKIAGLGMKVGGVFTYPIWKVAFNILGQPYFADAIEKGLNPFTKYRLDSPVGEASGLKESQRVGILWPPVGARGEHRTMFIFRILQP